MSRITRRHTLGLLTAVAGSGLAAPMLAQQSKPKVAFMMNGTPEDVGWNFEHQRGMEQAQAMFADSVQIDPYYGVKEWGEGDKDMLKTLVADGYDMIFGASFGYMGAMVEASFTAPETKFEHCGGYIRAHNLSTYSIRWYEGRAPQGLIAGAVTKTNRIGYMVSFPIAQILRGINAAWVQARAVNPDVEFEVVFLNTWFDPAKEEQAARDLIARGADVVMAHTNSTKPVEVAQELGKYGFGQASDMAAYGPEAQLTASINSWGPYYVRRIMALLDGSWETKETWGGLEDEMLTMGPISDDVPNRVHLQAEDLIQRMSTGQTSPFVGPLKRQDGSAWLAPGETASDHDLLTMDFFLEGLGGVIPGRS